MKYSIVVIALTLLTGCAFQPRIPRTVRGQLPPAFSGCKRCTDVDYAMYQRLKAEKMVVSEVRHGNQIYFIEVTPIGGSQPNTNIGWQGTRQAGVFRTSEP